MDACHCLALVFQIIIFSNPKPVQYSWYHKIELMTNCFTSERQNVIAGNILSLISDHLPQFAILSENAPDYKTSSYFSYDYKTFDEAKFLADYKEMDTSFLDDGSQDLNGKFDTFLLNLHNLVNKHCPKKKLNKRALKLKKHTLD